MPRIRELTKRWRTEETERKALAEKYAALEHEIATLKAPKPPAIPEPPKPFEAPRPTMEQFAEDADPFDAYTRATTRHEIEQREAEQAKARYESERQAAEQAQRAQRDAHIQQLKQAHATRVNAFKASTPDFDAVVNTVPYRLPDLLQVALLEDDRSAEFVYALAKRPELLSEALLLSDGRAVTEDNVGNLRRLLASRMPVASTGSTASVPPTYVPPKPPNPVRTGPMKTADEPPGEGASIADHARYYGRPRH